MMAWIASLQGTVILLGSAAMMGWGWIKFVHDPKVEGKVTEKIVQASKKEGADRAAKSKKAIDAAAKPGAFERLRKDPATCPDCPR